MKCTVRQYCAYLCRIINHENRTTVSALTETLTDPPSAIRAKKGAPYHGQKKKQRTAYQPAHPH